MPIDRYLIGSDGNVSISVGTTPTVQNIFKVNSYAATLSRFAADHTSFGDTGRRMRLGMLDLQGSLNCIVGVFATATSTATSLFTSTMEGTNRPSLALTIYDGAGTNDCKITSNVVLNSFAFNSNAATDATCTVNFMNADGVAPVVTWLSET